MPGSQACGLGVAGDGVPAQGDAGGEDHAVVGQGGAGAQAQGFGGGVDAVDPVVDDVDAAGAQGVEGMGDVGEGAGARQDEVGVRAGDDAGLGLDEGDVEPGVGEAGEFCRGGAAEAAADDDEAGHGSLGGLGFGDGWGGDCGSLGGGQETTAGERGIHCGMPAGMAANWAAAAAISAWV